MNTLYIILAIIAFMGLVGYVVSNYCFDDTDQDMDWHDNYSVIECPHHNRTDVTVESTVTCETIYTICDDCCEVLKQRTEC